MAEMTTPTKAGRASGGRGRTGPDAVEERASADVRDSAGSQASTSGSTYDLGPLNRHWYRRCLDALDERLRENSTNPSINELKDLCDSVVTGFLTAVTGQSPDSSRLQFPADRAYFIPFEGDLAERFNFSKPFYRLKGEPSGKQKERLYEHSVWSFYPWAEGGTRIEIDNQRSVDGDGKTIPFEEMISVRAQFVGEEAEQERTSTGTQSPLLLEKSLVLRGEDRSYLGRLFAADDRRGEAARQALYEGCAVAMRAIFDVYRMTPGNVAVESILLNHVTVIRWLLAMLGQERKETQEGKLVPVAEQDEDFKNLFLAFLRHFFFGARLDSRLGANEETFVKNLLDFLDPRDKEAADEAQGEASGDRQTRIDFYAERAKKGGTPFSAQVTQLRKSQEGFAEETGDPFQAIEADLRNFRQYLLSVTSEERIENDLAAALEDKLLKAGDSRQSFIWVIPDFERIDDSVPQRFEVQKRMKKEVHALSGSITEAYKSFYERFDSVCVDMGDRRKKLEAYWRTLGQANREQLVFSSFKDSSVGLHVAEMAVATKADGEDLRKKRSNRPQNFFLRVKICDSLNEPVINGLFILSTDHDEVNFKGKLQDLRKEDQEDLLAFGKVYFFIVRDYFRALDQSQAARDIGQLNQYLYDKRLGDLDQRMQRRIETQAGSIADEKNWPLFTYEIINNYAFSLIEKPEDVQSETFPYDRLLVLPLGEERKGSYYDLPFYLFQALFAERQAGEIQSGLYSLIKPFQSPIEESEEAGERFRVKSFQKVSKTGSQGQEVRLERYLEKIYLSAQEQPFGGADAGRQGKEPGARRQVAATAPTEPESFVVKLLREEKDSPDHGRDWVAQAVDNFWSRFGPQERLDLWRSFLNNLTESFEQLGRSDRTGRESGEEQWFLLRLGLLRVLLSDRSKREERIEVIRRAYDNDLKLRFNNDRSLDVVKWATDEDPFTRLAERLSRLVERLEIQFEPFTLRSEDPFVLTFFRHLTNLVCNRYENEKEDAEKGWTNESQATWYQPLLTRPLEVSGEGRIAEGIGSNLALHVAAGQKIKHRLPPYEQIEAGKHALSMFLGVVNFSVGQGKQRARLRCLVAMIRDYDDAQAGTDFAQKEREQQLEVDRKEREQQLEVDRRDLSLYTTTFFRNVQKFVKDAMAREENKVLSTDISQIARNWYSSGMDRISLHLRQRLDQLLEDRTDFRFGGLRPEIVDTFFDSMLEVLLRTEERPGAEGKDILLESFPFDRLLHIPLGLGSVGGSRLCYARTRIVDARPNEGDMERWGSLSARQCYERIRRNGRTWLQSNGRKTAEQLHHFGFADERLVDSEDLAALMRRIGQPKLLDSLVRSLYEANAIQTLAIAGLLLQLLGNGENDAIRQRLEAVVVDSIRSVEQQASAAAESSIHTEVYMDREAILCQLSTKAYDGSDADLRRDLQNIRLLPAWYDFFKAVEKPSEEKTSEDFVYGLRRTQQNEVLSKLFYVYYSIEAPHTFTEVPAMGSRFRGILALVLDDASTDLKSEIGEIADQQDIRTFVHNGVRSLQLILENQGLANRLRQPGIERFVLGMLHRLKNELGKPMAVLHILKESSRSASEIEQIERATSAINGLRELFKNLRGLEDVQQGIVPIRPFSTHWLGWLFIVKLTVAARKAAEGLTFDPNQAKDALQDLERIRELAESELKVEPKDPLRAVDVIQREIKNVENVVRKLVAGRAGAGPVDVVLSYQVFSENPLEFLGSFHLEEALNILIENAFQAFWEHLDPRSDKAAKSGLLRMICRQSRERSGEILIEISNSTAPIDGSVLLVLNDRVAQPMTQQQHASKSGKKGGSGFGHYYARRTVSELCGGREARRELDVKIDYLEEIGLARVRVNLIEASSGGLQSLSAEQVQAEVRRNFDREFALGLEAAGRYHLPQNIDARSLFNLIRRLLVADREALEKAFLSWWRSRVCSMLSDRCDNLRKRLLDRLTILADTDPEGRERWREILGQIQVDGVAKVRRSSFHDLHRFLQQVRDRGDGSLLQIIDGNELLEKLLGSFTTGANGFELEPQSLINAGEKEKIAKELKRYELHLKKDLNIEDVPKLLLVDIDHDERGRPVPSGDGVASFLEPSQWRLDKTTRNGNLHLAVSLVDGNPKDAKIELNHARYPRLEMVSEDYQIERQTFQSYSRLFERTLREGAPVGLLWMEVPAKEPRRTVHLWLSGASKQ